VSLPARHVIFDASGLVALGRGTRIGSRLIDRAARGSGSFVYAPTCSLVEADRSRPGTAEHVAALPGVTVLDLDLPTALSMMSWQGWDRPHVLYCALPNLDRPEGAAIATANPEPWRGRTVRLIDLREEQS